MSPPSSGSIDPASGSALADAISNLVPADAASRLLSGDDASRLLSGGNRAVSTVLDVALFVLLVSAAVGVLYAVPEPDAGTDSAAGDDAAAVATTLTASTATVQYTPGSDTDGGAELTDRGTVSELLAAATVANATVGGQPLGPHDDYVAAVQNETRATLAAVGGGTEGEVRARWTPLPGADVRSEARFGPTPPPDADVHAATVTVPLGTARASGVVAAGWREATGRGAAGTENRSLGAPPNRSVVAGPDRSLVETAQAEGCTGLARAIARRVVGHVFPPGPTGAALRGDAASHRRAVARYETLATAVGTDPDDVPLADGPRAANAKLVDALAAEFEPIACDGYDDPVTAAREAAPDEVILVTRTWSA